MVCGNMDSYSFYNVQEQISGILTGKGVEHYHYVDNGAHDSIFYLPQFVKAVKYIEAKAYATGGNAADVISGDAVAAVKDGNLAVDYTLNVDGNVSKYIDEIILRDDSAITPELQIPVEVRVIKDGAVVASATEYHSVADAAEVSGSVEIAGLAAADDYTVSVYASVLEDTKLIKSVNAEVGGSAGSDSPFEDVAEDAYYYDAVLWAVENGITKGKTATTFDPSSTCTRAQVVTFLWRAAGKPEPTLTECPFEDVAENAYYYDAVLWAVENGITTGKTATTILPNSIVRREQVATFLWRAAGKPESTLAECPFEDVAENAFYYDAVLWAYENGITNGKTETTFGVDSGCTRAEIVAFLYRANN